MVELLMDLSGLNGVSGNEKPVRDFIVSRIQPYADNIRIDNFGNIIAFKQGGSSKPTLLISAHMDEIGLIVSGITEDGFIKFKAVGNFDARHIISKCVKINDTVDGILGMKAIHLQKKEERDATVAVKDLYIDIGAKNKKNAMKLVKPGDYISFASDSFRTGSRLLGKALDGRAGCACLIELMKKEYDNDIYFVFTAQREIGMRGAAAAAYGINADMALVLEGTEAADMYGCDDKDMTAELGKGVCISYMDKYAISDRDMTSALLKLLEKAKISVQVKHRASALTDTGGIQQSGYGIRTACIAVPVRYSHTPCGMIDTNDVFAMRDAAELFIGKAGKEL